MVSQKQLPRKRPLASRSRSACNQASGHQALLHGIPRPVVRRAPPPRVCGWPASTPAAESPAAEEVVRQSGLRVSLTRGPFGLPAPCQALLHPQPHSARPRPPARLDQSPWSSLKRMTGPSRDAHRGHKFTNRYLSLGHPQPLPRASVHKLPRRRVCVQLCAEGGGQFSARSQPSRHGHTESSSERC